jgi:hypothetical protein
MTMIVNEGQPQRLGRGLRVAPAPLRSVAYRPTDRTGPDRSSPDRAGVGRPQEHHADNPRFDDGRHVFNVPFDRRSSTQSTPTLSRQARHIDRSVAAQPLNWECRMPAMGALPPQLASTECPHSRYPRATPIIPRRRVLDRRILAGGRGQPCVISPRTAPQWVRQARHERPWQPAQDRW